MARTPTLRKHIRGYYFFKSGGKETYLGRVDFKEQWRRMCLLVAVINQPYSESEEEGEGVFGVDSGGNFVRVTVNAARKEGVVHKLDETVHGCRRGGVRRRVEEGGMNHDSFSNTRTTQQDRNFGHMTAPSPPRGRLCKLIVLLSCMDFVARVYIVRRLRM